MPELSCQTAAVWQLNGIPNTAFVYAEAAVVLCSGRLGLQNMT